MRRILMLALVGLFGLSMVRAQDQAGPNQDQSQTPQTSTASVARLSAISGSVSTQRGDTGEWVAGRLNAPLVSGDKVSAAANSRAEVQLDSADTLRLGDGSQANLTNLTQNQIQIQLAAGLADYVVFKNPQASTEIDTPNVAIRPRGAGVFRILVSSDSETEVIVRRGDADISTPQGSTALHQGQLITVQGTDTPQYKISDAPAEDAWDRWNNDRDRVAENSPSLRYTNSNYTGVQDLDNYGYWTYVPGYGQVWVPNGQGSNWSPYSDGSWTWEPNWGWTWVGYEPWGWAPYHYGRWFWWGSSWAWWPGPVTPFYRPIWAPAYVSFFGWGGGFGFGFGFGSVGWLPIGPCDPFRPWWGRGFGFNRVNITNINITNVNVVNVRGGRIVSPLMPVGRGHATFSNLDAMRSNARVRNALIRVPSAQFGRGGIQGRERVSAAELNRGSLVGGHLPVVPARQSLTMGRSTTTRAAVPHAATSFFGTHSNTAARASFGQEQSRIQTGMRTAGQASVGGQRMGAVRNAAPAAGMQRFDARAGAGAGTAVRAGNSGATMDRNSRTTAPATGEAARPGWQRFGASPQNGAPQRGTAPREPQAQRGAMAQPQSQRGMMSEPQSQRPAARQGWSSFNGRSAAPSGPRAAEAPQRAADPGFQRFTPQPREAGGQNRGGGSSRPPLEMGHQIVQAPRSSGGGGYFDHPGYFGGSGGNRPSGNSGGNFNSRPAYSGGGGGGRPSGGGMSRPSGGGFSGGGRPSGGGMSHGSSGGGMSHGGGGGMSHGGGGGGHGGGHGRG
ncbi:MAG: DUF6600 domain-containing protein [Terriglobales bacterium]